LAQDQQLYLVYLPQGGTSQLDLSGTAGEFTVHWFNPRSGGQLNTGSVARVVGGGKVSLGKAPSDTELDWLVVVKK
jgi:hypothetical protein